MPADWNRKAMHMDSHGTNRHSDNPASRWTALLLGLMMLLAPALGVPSEEMLQDTLKSAIIANMTLLAALTFLGFQLRQQEPLCLHRLLLLPVGLACYAGTSMTWSHAYLAGVETARWLVFSVLTWLCLNLRRADFENRVLGGIHWGVTVASIWTALQFWANLSPFPQGPNPASTFLNRNFFAEFAICALPFSGYLLWRSTSVRETALRAASTGFNVVALLMTGTRSAVLALIILAGAVALLRLFIPSRIKSLPVHPHKLGIAGLILLATILVLGSIPTNNPKLIAEFGRQSAIERSLGRVASIAKPDEYTTGSFSMRYDMWNATARMISAAPVTGVGAGAWEVYIPLYQKAGTQLEADFYAHNELVQLVAEYGIVGWIFLGVLFGYIGSIALEVLGARNAVCTAVNPIQAAGLLSLLMLLIVSNAGFPWRMAGTAALFAIGLSMIAAREESAVEELLPRVPNWYNKKAGTLAAFAISLIALVLALYTTGRAAAAERNLIRGIKLALTISHSPDPTSAYWDEPKKEIVSMMRDGIHLNRHYRKLIPVAADELARMGDWQEAQWMWETVLESRPYIVAIMANVARAHMERGDFTKADAMLKRASAVQPKAPVVHSLEILLLARMGQNASAADALRRLFQQQIVDAELVQAAYVVGERLKDWPLKIQALELRARHWPALAVEAWLEAGDIYASQMDPVRALEAYRAALAAAPKQQRDAIFLRIPPGYRNRL